MTRVLAQGCKLHFTFEQLVVSSIDQIADLEEFVSLIDLSQNQNSIVHALDGNN